MERKKNNWFGFYKEYKLHKACANDDLRTAMHYILFNNGYAYATNAHIAVRANLHNISALSDEEIAKLNGYLIHKDQYEMMLKYSTIEIGDGIITLIKTESKASTVIQLKKLARTIEDVENGNGEYIRYPKVDEVINNDLSIEPLQKFGFNYSHLGRIISAMGLDSKKVGLRFTSHGKQMIVLGVEPGIDVRGIIMPVLLEY